MAKAKYPKKRGRPPTGSIGVLVRMTPDQLAKLDNWISDQPEPKSMRPESVRSLIDPGILHKVWRFHEPTSKTLASRVRQAQIDR